jgi:hypothetical protein
MFDELLPHSMRNLDLDQRNMSARQIKAQLGRAGDQALRRRRLRGMERWFSFSNKGLPFQECLFLLIAKHTHADLLLAV